MRTLLSAILFRRRRIGMLGAAFAGIGYFGFSSARADSVSIANPVAMPSTVSLSTGTLDWAHYATTNPPSDGVVFSTFDHPLGTRFSSVTGINGSLEGYDATANAPVITWNGGTPDATGSSRSWEFNTNNNAASGETFSYDLAPGSKLIHLYVDGYNGTSATPLTVEVQAFLSSGANATNTSPLPAFWLPDSSEDGDFAITAINSTQSDETLTLNYFQPASQNGSAGNGSNVGIFGVTASAVPEPGSISFLSVAGLSMLRRGRKPNTST